MKERGSATKTGKRFRLFGITIYSRCIDGDSETKYILGIPVTRRVIDQYGLRRYFMGICYRRKPRKSKPLKWRVHPPELPTEEYVRLKRSEPKEVLIVPAPGIGDYIIVRNYIRLITKSDKYRGYRFVLLCDVRNREFAECLDSDVIDEFVACKEAMPLRDVPLSLCEKVRKALMSDGLKKYYDTIILISFFINGAEQRQVVNHLLSRVSSRERIGFYYAWRKEKAQQYSHLTRAIPIWSKTNRLFLFDVLRDAIGRLLDQKLEISHPIIESAKITHANPVCSQEKYMVFNPCASADHRFLKMWHRNNWVELLSFIKKEYGFRMILVCSEGERDFAEKLKEEAAYEEIEIDIMAGLSINSLLALLKNASFYVGLDSGIFHIAAAMGIKTLCLSSGQGFPRFLMGYNGRETVRVLYPRGWEHWFTCDLDESLSAGWPGDTHPINAIRVQEAVGACQSLLGAIEKH